MNSVQNVGKDKAGFILLELLLVIGLLLLLTTFVFARGREREQSVDLAAKELAAVIRLGYSLEETEATAQGTFLSLTASPQGISYILKQNGKANPSEKGKLPGRIEFYIQRSQDFSLGMPLGQPRTSYVLNFEGRSIKAPNGDGMTIILKEKNSSSQRILTVVPTSGRVLIKR